MSKPSVVLATHNRHKMAEFERLARAAPWTLLSLSDFQSTVPEESGTTFVENALLKAKAASALTQLPAIADDSGLLVPALDGQPGLFSARYAGSHASDAENRQALCHALHARGLTMAPGCYHAVLIYVATPDDPRPIIGEGTWWGQVHAQASGGTGFGYDPLFHLPDSDCRVAQLPPDVKATLSHRASAWRQLVGQWIQRQGDAHRFSAK